MNQANTQPSTHENQAQQLEASFSTLVLSIASAAAMALGIAPHPVSGKTEKDLNLARFNIDLLTMLSEKTKNNRTPDEERFIISILQDLKMKFIQG
jgi:hypothetical protein